MVLVHTGWYRADKRIPKRSSSDLCIKTYQDLTHDSCVKVVACLVAEE
jgi:hypothetical protein